MNVFGIIFALLFCIISFGCQSQHLQIIPEKDYHLFCYFKGNGEDGLHLAYSTDGVHWQTLNDHRSLLRPTVGRDKLMRDPCICRGPDGTFHMVWTVSWGEKGIGYACSTDLIHWSSQRYVGVMEHEPAAKNCWAPELFYDAPNNQFLIFWATTIPGRFPATDGQCDACEAPAPDGNNHRIYYVTTKDFESFSDTTLLYNHGFNVIDSTIIQDRGRYMMFLKDETCKPFKPQKNIRIAYADQAEGPYSPPGEPITGDYWCEGPTALKIGKVWYLYFDKYQNHCFGALTSRDLIHWQDISDPLVMPEGIRHGTAFTVKGKTLKPLLLLN